MRDRWRKIKRRILLTIFPGIISSGLKIVHSTIRWKYEGLDNVGECHTPIVFSFFHARMLMLPFTKEKLMGLKKLKMIRSPHFDGELIGQIILRMGIESLKGSSSKNPVKLLKEISKKEGCSIGITPDGPRGPSYKVKDGVVFISKITGYPIVPVAYAVKKCRKLNTWDKFIIPYPFTSGVYVCGEPIVIPKDIPNEVIPEWTKKVEKAMLEVCAKADELAAGATW